MKVRMGNAYLARLQYAATRDAKVTEAFMRVVGLLDPPEALMRPRMAARVFRHAVRRPRPYRSWLEQGRAAGVGDHA